MNLELKSRGQVRKEAYVILVKRIELAKCKKRIERKWRKVKDSCR
jgi:hypothetical protein